MRVSDLIDQSSSSPLASEPSMLYMLTYDILGSLSTKIHSTSTLLRQRLGLPLSRQSTQKYSIVEENNDEAEFQKFISIGQASGAGTPMQIDDKKKSAPAGSGKKAAVAPVPAGKVDAKKPVGKKGDALFNDELSSAPAQAFKPDSEWTDERRQYENKYLKEIEDEARALVLKAVGRISKVLGEAAR
jgi:hypothetical protein